MFCSLSLCNNLYKESNITQLLRYLMSIYSVGILSKQQAVPATFLPYFPYRIPIILLLLLLQGQSKKIPNFFLNLLLYLQLNQTCLLQSTPLYCWYTTPSVFSNSETRPGTCFAGWREGPVVNYLLSPLPSEIGAQ